MDQRFKRTEDIRERWIKYIEEVNKEENKLDVP